ncbi:hypothetical protein DM02DRAFT_622590 [Periconia macrospinosa]|uniref:GPI anchored serine-rich protein n=1 Tax=Periconia macrospinosa TaxID=97972 RepID=A0A2V1EB24_9PLEO|nr:hypothetical protein DM02DRAFT_622590 [Periconia macrospinosa]
MKFFAIASFLVAAVSASTYSALPAADEDCSVVYVTKTVTLPAGVHTPVPVASTAAVIPPYPTAKAPYPVVPAPSGVAPSGSVPGAALPTGTAAAPKPSGTGAYSVPPGEFTGSASGFKAGGALAGVAAVAAFFL